MADSDCIIVHEQVVVPDAVVVEEMVALPGEKGDKGDPFTYDDFTPEQIADLQRPATEAAKVANQAAEKANQAAESIAYKENGFYISHAFLEATDLRYIGFKEIKNDKTCYLLTMGRCLKFWTLTRCFGTSNWRVMEHDGTKRPSN